ncbi:hypothetical protein ACLBXM_19935 [Xanthobacteraceae bacterium A53D]
MAGLVPLVLMTSFARSGETLVLRSLNAHPRIKVVHHIVAGPDEDPDDMRLARALVHYPDRMIRRTHPYLAHANVHPRGRIVVKHAVWTHRHPAVEFVLARNPFAAIASLQRYGVEHNESEDHRRKRLARWARGIAPEFVGLCKTGDEVEAAAHLYNAKMTATQQDCVGLIRYEDVTRNPEAEFRRLMNMLGLGWSSAMLESHTHYRQGRIGHGGIKLSEPIRLIESPYSGGLARHHFEMVSEITRPALALMGYEVDAEAQAVRLVEPQLMGAKLGANL